MLPDFDFPAIPGRTPQSTRVHAQWMASIIVHVFWFLKTSMWFLAMAHDGSGVDPQGSLLAFSLFLLSLSFLPPRIQPPTLSTTLLAYEDSAGVKIKLILDVRRPYLCRDLVPSWTFHPHSLQRHASSHASALRERQPALLATCQNMRSSSEVSKHMLWKRMPPCFARARR